MTCNLYCTFRIIETAEQMLQTDININVTLSDFGAKAILGSLGDDIKVSVLTHCNTGSLATAGYGTALGNDVL